MTPTTIASTGVEPYRNASMIVAAVAAIQPTAAIRTVVSSSWENCGSDRAARSLAPSDLPTSRIQVSGAVTATMIAGAQSAMIAASQSTELASTVESWSTTLAAAKAAIEVVNMARTAFA